MPGGDVPDRTSSRAECIDIVYWLLTCHLEDDENDELTLVETELELSAQERDQCQAFLSGLSCSEARCAFGHDDSCGDIVNDPGVAACNSLVSVGDEGGNDDDDGFVSDQYGECYSNDNCGAGTFCDRPKYDDDDEVTVCSACIPPLPEGAACEPYNSYVPCEEGVVCHFRGPDANTCTPAYGEGAECGYQSADCAPPLTCHRSGPNPDTCGAPYPDGTACLDQEECAGGFCDPDIGCRSDGDEGDACADGGDCRYPFFCNGAPGACERPRANGAPCTNYEQCNNYFCDTDAGTCGSPNGTACSGAFDSDDCASLYCDEATLVCADRPPLPDEEGASCDTFIGCAAPLTCNNAQCVRTCSESGDCAAGEFCGYDGSTNRCQAKRADGSGCEDDDECVNGYCNDNDICGAKPGIGDPCVGFSDCYPLGFCNASSVCERRKEPGAACEGLDTCLQPYVCLEQRCTLMPLTCEPQPAGERCAFFRFCDENSWCDVADDFTCAERVGERAVCDGNPEKCRAGLNCAFDEAFPERGYRCVEAPGEGDACDPNTNPCAPDLFCAANPNTPGASVCLAGPAGQPCDSFSEPSGCPDGYFCDDSGFDDACAPVRVEGDACDSFQDDQCAPNLYCNNDVTPSVCTVQPGIGDACDRFTGCTADAYCNDITAGTCIARDDEGDECADDPLDAFVYAGTCRAGLLCDDDTSPSTCQQPHANGTSCTNGFECASNICSSAINACVAQETCVVR